MDTHLTVNQAFSDRLGSIPRSANNGCTFVLQRRGCGIPEMRTGIMFSQVSRLYHRATYQQVDGMYRSHNSDR